MILLDMALDPREEDEDDPPILVFKFSNGYLGFECPTGMPAKAALQAFKDFILIAEGIIESESETIH